MKRAWRIGYPANYKTEDKDLIFPEKKVQPESPMISKKYRVPIEDLVDLIEHPEEKRASKLRSKTNSRFWKKSMLQPAPQDWNPKQELN